MSQPWTSGGRIWFMDLLGTIPRKQSQRDEGPGDLIDFQGLDLPISRIAHSVLQAKGK